MSTPTAVVVDGYSTGNFLPAAFAKLGVDLAHVQSSAELMPTMLPPALDRDYRDNLVCADVAALAALAPVVVLAGQEPGVPLADALSERLGLATTGTARSLARRDKYRMIETLRAAGLRCADQHLCADPAEVAAWAERTGYPVVVKPLSSASTDHVYICHDAGEAAAAAARTVALLGVEVEHVVRTLQVLPRGGGPGCRHPRPHLGHPPARRVDAAALRDRARGGVRCAVGAAYRHGPAPFVVDFVVPTVSWLPTVRQDHTSNPSVWTKITH
ncbi:MAG TPA: hypothetical protein VGP26_31380 [Actinophytocola sp.]|jgi:hypothetical protein|nr:hypothetical protein [Actinophytocola sp.]